MVKDQLVSLGPEAQWFDRPADVRYIPDYYQKIKNPMDLGTMLQKLDSGRYKNPQSFCNVSSATSRRQHCRTVSRQKTQFRQIQENVSHEDLLWLAINFDCQRRKHTTLLMQDMRQVWANCLEYNGKGSKYGKIGDRCSAAFEEAWAASGLDSGDRHRRTNAGHAATRLGFHRVWCPQLTSLETIQHNIH